MSIYRKNELGQVKATAGNIVQRWNNRIFTTYHELVVQIGEGMVDEYTISSLANKYILSLTDYTEFQLYVNETNSTNHVYIKYGGRRLKLKLSNDEEFPIGFMHGRINVYTLNTSSGFIFTDSALDPSTAEIEGIVENVVTDGSVTVKKAEQDDEGNNIAETYSTKSELSNHNSSNTAHLPIRQEIEVIRQDVSRIEGRVKSYGEINYTQSELMALNEGARNTAIYDDILARFEDYTLANGDAVYTKASATDNDHEWEYNGNTWVDNGAYILQKASNTLFGVVKGGNVYTNIINGLIEVILSDYATKVGDSTNSYTYQQLKTILDTYASDIADRYTKSEVYNKTEIDNMGFSTNDYTNEDKQNVEKIPTIEQYILDLVNDKVSKTSIVDNLTTDDAIKVLSAKQGKALQDTKEAIVNKAIDFSVLNDTKYPTTKAVKDLVDTTLGNIDTILDNILGV